MNGPNLNELLPDAVLTNVATNLWANGGFAADRLAGVKQVPKDRYKFSTWDKSVLQHLFNTFRAPGDRANAIPRPAKAYTEGLIKENAIRAEYTQEDVDNSLTPDEPRVTATARIVNALQFVVENLVHDKYLVAGLAAANKTQAAAKWDAATTSIRKDVEKAKETFYKRTGIEPNYILMPRHVWTAFIISKEITDLRIYTENMFRGQDGRDVLPVFGLQPIVPGMRYDSAPSGTYTPAFVWGDNDVWIGYSPAVNGGGWDGTAPTFLGQFEATLTGQSAFAVKEYQSPFFAEDKTFIITSDFRRTVETINAEFVHAVHTVL